MTSHSPVSSASRSPTFSCIGSTRLVLEDAGCRGVGNGSCPPAFRSGFFLGRCLAIAAGLSQFVPRQAVRARTPGLRNPAALLHLRSVRGSKLKPVRGGSLMLMPYALVALLALILAGQPTLRYTWILGSTCRRLR